MRRALLLACSQRKAPDHGLLRAIERYDGPAFRVLRRYLRASGDRDLIVYIMSAEFGLIPGSRSIPSYDRRMTRERAAELAPSVARDLTAAIHTARPSELFICAGETYVGALAGWKRGPLNVHFAAPGQGRKLRSLKNWLYGEQSGDIR